MYSFLEVKLNKQMKTFELLKVYIWTLSYFKYCIVLSLLYVFAGGVLVWGELAIPKRIGYLIDNVLPYKKTDLLIEETLFLVMIILIILASKAVFQFVEIVISNRIIKTQQMDLMTKLQKLGFAFCEENPTGKILSIFENSVKETQRTYTFLFPHFIYSLAQFVVPSVILIMNVPIFFIASMIGNVIYVILNQYANKKIREYLGEESKAAQTSQQLQYDSIVGSIEIQAFGSEKWMINKVMHTFDHFSRMSMGSVYWRHFRFTTVGLTLTISLMLFYSFGLDLIQSGELLTGEFVGYSFLMGLISRGFSVFFYIVPAQQHALSYAKDLYDFMNEKPRVSDICEVVTDPIKHLDIEFNNVSFGYTDDKLVLENLSFKIEQGKKVAFVGESGSGKSTILKLFCRFYDVTAGEVLIGGVNIKRINLEKLRNLFGFVFQDTYLFDLSIMENINFGNPDASKDHVIEAAKKSAIHSLILGTEKGYNTRIGERGVRLSGGEKQRLSIARTLLRSPSIVLLDEATSALDSVNEIYIKEMLSKEFKDKTVVLVAHRLSTIKDCDEIIVLDNGTIAEIGNYDSLINRRGIFYELVMRGEQDAS